MSCCSTSVGCKHIRLKNLINFYIESCCQLFALYLSDNRRSVGGKTQTAERTINCKREQQCMCKMCCENLYCISVLYLHLTIYPLDKVGYIAVDSWLVPPSTSNPPASVPCQPPYISLFDHQGPSTITLQHRGGINIRLV